jgi:hypothetical protein
MAESHKPGVHDDRELPILSEQQKPALDEATFQQLLEAAHVLQEQKGFEAASRPRPDPAEALAEIVETQERLRSQPSDLYTAANLIVERLQKITSATGVAVAIVHENQLEYCAATGDAASLVGSRLAFDSSLLADGRLSTPFSRAHFDKHSIALSLLHDGKLAGLLEVGFADADSIPEPEMRSCQLMAGLMTEAIARAVDNEWKQTLAAERAAMLEALERIKPQLERLAIETPVQTVESRPLISEPSADFLPTKEPRKEIVQPQAPEPIVPASTSTTRMHSDTRCPQCGYQFGEHELFCGRCGTARQAETLLSGDLQSKWASMWHMQQVAENRQREVVEEEVREDPAVGSVLLSSTAVAGDQLSSRLLSQDSSELSPELEKMMAQFSPETTEPEPATAIDAELLNHGEVGENTPPALAEVAKTEPSPSPWGSATNAKNWLESVDSKSPAGIWLAKHRADIYVGAALVLLLLAWGIRSPENHAQAKNPQQPSLTLFEKLMVTFGLAETPAVPVYLGNPNAQVWVDLHTALYYCADSELYGKTPGGKFTTQRDAQLDQFEPAARKNCD